MTSASSGAHRKLWCRLKHPLSCPGFVGCRDDAYSGCSSQIVTIFPGDLSEFPERDAWNFWASNCRIQSECCFALLCGKWGCLWRPLKMNLANTIPVLMCLTKLHNFCIDWRLKEQHRVQRVERTQNLYRSAGNPNRYCNGDRDLQPGDEPSCRAPFLRSYLPYDFRDQGLMEVENQTRNRSRKRATQKERRAAMVTYFTEGHANDSGYRRPRRATRD